MPAEVEVSSLDRALIIANIACLGFEANSRWSSEESEIAGSDRSLIIASIAFLGSGAISTEASESETRSSSLVDARALIICSMAFRGSGLSNSALLSQAGSFVLVLQSFSSMDSSLCSFADSMAMICFVCVEEGALVGMAIT